MTRPSKHYAGETPKVKKSHELASKPYRPTPHQCLKRLTDMEPSAARRYMLPRSFTPPHGCSGLYGRPPPPQGSTRRPRAPATPPPSPLQAAPGWSPAQTRTHQRSRTRGRETGRTRQPPVAFLPGTTLSEGRRTAGGGGGRVSGKGGRTYPSRGTVRGAACGPVRGQDKRPLLQRPAPPSPPLPSGRAGDRAASPPPLPAGHSQLQAGVGRRCRRSCRRRHPSPPSGRRRLGSASFSPPPLPPVRTD